MRRSTTDKVHKIKEWISKTQDGLMDANGNFEYPEHEGAYHILCNLDAYIDSLQEEPDPYIQYASREAGIKAHAETYSFNIESELFNQLTKEQQALWRKEIEQACISGGYSGLNLAKDPRYKENLEVKEVVRINTSLSDIDDDLKKLGVDPDSKQAKMLKDCYYRAIDRILEKGEEV